MIKVLLHVHAQDYSKGNTSRCGLNCGSPPIYMFNYALISTPSTSGVAMHGGRVFNRVMKLKEAWDFPDSSAGKESACNPGDPGSVPGSGIQPLGILGAQMIKKPPAMRETWVQSLGREDLLEEGMATHSSILAWRIPRTVEPGRLQPMGRKESDTLNDSAQHRAALIQSGLLQEEEIWPQTPGMCAHRLREDAGRRCPRGGGRPQEEPACRHLDLRPPAWAVWLWRPPPDPGVLGIS